MKNYKGCWQVMVIKKMHRICCVLFVLFCFVFVSEVAEGRMIMYNVNIYRYYGNGKGKRARQVARLILLLFA